jgi:hypothetical protein
MSFIRRALRKLELPEREQGDRWGNEDIRPVPLERQTWGTNCPFPELTPTKSYRRPCPVHTTMGIGLHEYQSVS